MQTRILMALVLVVLFAGFTFADSVTFVGDDYNTKGDWKANPQPVDGACALGYGSYAHIQPYGGTETPWTPASDEYWSDTTYGPVTYWTTGYYGDDYVGVHPTVTWNWGLWSVEKPADPRATWYEIGNGLGAHWYLACWDDNGEAHSWLHGFMDFHLHFPYVGDCETESWQLGLWAYDKENTSRVSQTYQFFVEGGDMTAPILEHRITDEFDAEGNPTNPLSGNGAFYNGIISVFNVEVTNPEGFDLIVRVYNDVGRFSTPPANLNVLLSAIFVDYCGCPELEPPYMVVPNAEVCAGDIVEITPEVVWDSQYDPGYLEIVDVTPAIAYNWDGTTLTVDTTSLDGVYTFTFRGYQDGHGYFFVTDNVAEITVHPWQLGPVITTDPVQNVQPIEIEVLRNENVDFNVIASYLPDTYLVESLELTSGPGSFVMNMPTPPAAVISGTYTWTVPGDFSGTAEVWFTATPVYAYDTCGEPTLLNLTFVYRGDFGHGFTPGFWFNNAKKNNEHWTHGIQVPYDDYMAVLNGVIAGYPTTAGAWFTGYTGDDHAKLQRAMYLLSPSMWAKQTDQLKAQRMMLNLMLTGGYWSFHGETFLGGNFTIGSVTKTGTAWLADAIAYYIAGNYKAAFNITAYFSNDDLFPF